MGITTSMLTGADADPSTLSATQRFEGIDNVPKWYASIFASLRARTESEPTMKPRSAQELRASLPLSIDGKERTAAEAVELLRAVALATPHTASRTFFNQLFGGYEPTAVLAENVAVMLNSSLYTYKAAGIQTIIEHEVLKMAAKKMRFADSFDGTLAPGGSMSNFVALVCARNESFGKREDGQWAAQEDGLLVCAARHNVKRFTVYTSCECHYSISKATMMAGIGHDSLVYVESDAKGRMSVAALRAAIERDIADGAKPLFINATAGTTVCGAFDDIEAIADVADEFGIWLHVDAAWGGTIVLHKEHKALLKGIERAKSLTWDPHKLMGVPLLCSIVLIHRENALAEHFDEDATYLFQGSQEDLFLNPGRKAMQCGRKNDALKLWTLWQQLGDEGFHRRISEQFALRDECLRLVAAKPELYELVLQPEMLNVCFRVKGVAADDLCNRLYEEGRTSIGWASVKKEKIVRAVFTNAALQPSDVVFLFSQIEEVALKMRDGK